MKQKTISTFRVSMEWVHDKKVWVMNNLKTGFFIYDFWNCENFFRAFPHINMKRKKAYKITIEEIDLPKKKEKCSHNQQ